MFIINHAFPMLQPVAVCRYFANLGGLAGENRYDNLVMNMYVGTIDKLQKGR